MKQLFWDPLITIKEIEVKLDEHGLVEEEKVKLLEVAQQTFDMRILDLVLSHLPKQKHKRFLDKFAQIPDKVEVLEELKEDIEDIEDQIKELASKIKEEILSELTIL